MLTFISIICLIITARCHPYKNYWNNLIETLMLGDLLLITAYYLPESSRFVAAKDAFGIILLVVPFLYCIVYICVPITKRLWWVLWLHNPLCMFILLYYVHRFKFRSHRASTDDEDSAAKPLTQVSSDSDEKSVHRGSDVKYHEFRDDLLVLDSI